MVHGARYLDLKYLKYAEQTAQSMFKHLLSSEGQLKRTFMQGKAKHDGVLDDYTFLIQALIDLFEVSGNRLYLDKALLIQSYLDQHFWNTRQGAYYMTSDQAEKLISKDQPNYDGAEPSGNAVAAQNLLRLAQFTEKNIYLKRAEQVFKVFASQLSRGYGMNQMMSALLDYHGRARQLVIITLITSKLCLRNKGKLKQTFRSVINIANTSLVIRSNASEPSKLKI